MPKRDPDDISNKPLFPIPLDLRTKNIATSNTIASAIKPPMTPPTIAPTDEFPELLLVATQGFETGPQDPGIALMQDLVGVPEYPERQIPAASIPTGVTVQFAFPSPEMAEQDDAIFVVVVFCCCCCWAIVAGCLDFLSFFGFWSPWQGF